MSVDISSGNAYGGTDEAYPGYEDIVWDGIQHSYRPADDWLSRVSPALKLSTNTDVDLDPVTFEVLRNRLWTINIAHGDTLSRMSGSPIFQALDFNMSVLTEDAEIVMSAPFIQYLNTGSPLVARYIMERFSESPGIHEGDIFVGNDPWIGASHQMDVCITMPVFVDGELFAWVSNAAQQYDLGGIVPGGWPQNAPDVHSDPVLFTPFKLVERGVMRTDLEQMYRRHSRLPDMVALDLRAQLAGCRFAARRLQETCAEFGAPVVKSAMRRILDNAQAAFAEKLERLPDCTLSDVLYFDEKLPGDRTTHRVQFNITKRGSRLTIDNIGTEAQSDGPNGFTYMNFAGIVLGVTAQTILYEHTFSIGGAQRQIDFRPIPGLLSCCDYPAAVSGGVLNISSSYERLQNMFARLLATDPELKADIAVAGPDCPLTVLAGLDDRGNFFGTAVTAACGFGGGSRSYADGIETAGASYDPLIRMPNVEDTEARDPLLILYRKEAEDTGGAGRWRGGVGMEVALMTYRAGYVEIITNAGGQGVTTNQAMGVSGGHPSPTAHYKVLKSTNLPELLAGGQAPRTVDELSVAETLRLRPKSNGTALASDDVLLLVVSGGGGYGDPLDREPERVVSDVQRGYVSSEAAHLLYGVVVAADGELDAAATAARRIHLLDERRGWPAVPEFFGVPAEPLSSAATGEDPRAVQEYVVARDEGAHRVLACARCDTVLSDYRANYKFGLQICQTGVDVLPGVSDPRVFLDEDMVFRRYYCPGCHTLLTTEIARASEPVLGEVRFL
ncbi:N-methylhydantoinase B [Jatrophihabitans sp. GAS493]|uniref:hydantoinase B/oxoprolinase family protein n=1 Tax=Jatrophihabitans sp. GAS493 TaxID=1907575 RepID=UPI000BC08F41|nr:hydantoinase B/oxoprolinase family protein [Jatrophihabitans sp. GAS493]SOD72142.1 N-methylhydantoinase B [Jatrophihabitans sp. GAS493]